MTVSWESSVRANMYLTQRWAQTMRALNLEPTGKTTGLLRELLWMYNQEGRYYHTTEHLQSCFEVMDSVIGPVSVTVELALWYHDIVYNSRRKDNEVQSALLARARLGLLSKDHLANHVANLILCTKHDQNPPTVNAQVIQDVDLSILGASPEKFDAYEAAIRKEYAWVDEDSYRRVRGFILQDFLARFTIYHTPEFQISGYERRARENLARSLVRLS